MDIALDHPVFSETSPRAAHFFNGRLLTAEDLSREQQANTDGHKQLGRALGDGIVRGFEVTVAGDSTAERPVLTISSGLAFNRRGRTIELMRDVNLPLSKPATPLPGGDSSAAFEECASTQDGVFILDSEGVYLLTVKPAEAREGRALVSGLNNGASACNSKNRVAAVKFQLISLRDQLTAELSDLAVALQTNSDAANRLKQTHRLRNRVAHRCYGTTDARLDSFVADPFGTTDTAYGLLDDLRSNNTLTDCEVPLAVMYWTRAGVQFLDMWSVRRRITAPASAGFGWPFLADRRRAEGEAMFWQFQQQLNEVLRSGFPPLQVVAKDWFGFLPPLGLLPVGGPTATSGFNFSTFFSQMTYRQQIFVEGAQLYPLIQESLSYPAIAVSNHLAIWLYAMRENAQLALMGPASARPYLVFSSGHMPYRGDAHYDVHRWGFGNFS